MAGYDHLQHQIARGLHCLYYVLQSRELNHPWHVDLQSMDRAICHPWIVIIHNMLITSLHTSCEPWYVSQIVSWIHRPCAFYMVHHKRHDALVIDHTIPWFMNGGDTVACRYLIFMTTPWIVQCMTSRYTDPIIDRDVWHHAITGNTDCTIISHQSLHDVSIAPTMSNPRIVIASV